MQRDIRMKVKFKKAPALEIIYFYLAEGWDPLAQPEPDLEVCCTSGEKLSWVPDLFLEKSPGVVLKNPWIELRKKRRNPAWGFMRKWSNFLPLIGLRKKAPNGNGSVKSGTGGFRLYCIALKKRISMICRSCTAS
jgi:hypothetical protein